MNIKKIAVIVLGVCIACVVLVALAGMYKFNYLANQPGYDVDGNKIETVKAGTDLKNAAYTVDGTSVVLVDGRAEEEIAPGAASKITTRYFGNEVRVDLNDDGREDAVFLLTQETGGTGTFFYVVASLQTEDDWEGSHAYFLGDRIAPQTTEVSDNPNHQNVIVVNYADRETGQPMSVEPSYGVSVWLKFDPETMQFGEVEQNFPGEADPDRMSLEMKPWTWVRTTYNNDTTVEPDQIDAFTLTFSEDGSVSATTDCNSMSGTYTLEGNQITFGPMAATMMYCENSQEALFSKSLAETHSYFFTSRGELIFDLKFDSGSAVFR